MSGDFWIVKSTIHLWRLSYNPDEMDVDLDTITAGIRKDTRRKAIDEQQIVEARIDNIMKKTDELRQQLDRGKQWIAQAREGDAKRRAEIIAEMKQLQREQPRALDPVSLATSKARQRQEKVHNRTVDARSLLCRESALLAGLERRQGSGGKVQYWLGGVPILDLRRLARIKPYEKSRVPESEKEGRPKSHELISTGLDNVCRLLGNCCHYLSIRLPSEVILPFNKASHATILPEEISYKLEAPCNSEAATNKAPPPTTTKAPAESKFITKDAPRPLHITKGLSRLFKENHFEYLRFTEGVILLAYNVAWLCTSQGLSTINTIDDVYNMGKNLHDLFLGDDRPRLPLLRHIYSATTRTDNSRRGPSVSEAPRPGAWSHGTAHHSLSSADAVRTIREWQAKLPPVSGLIENLQNILNHEIAGDEWDMVSVQEGEEQPENDQIAVLVGGVEVDPAMSVMSIRPSDGAEDDLVAKAIARQQARRNEKGSSGWMRVRSRGGDG
ncbi:hypothetical protein LTR86_004165 [Recurvomyces mirabilis]|nr:hypothetical protein LTR86_004165 [Recurvomyces mirabilis]